MRTFSSLFLLATLGALSGAAAAAAVDTSQWKCETCPFEKAGVSGSVDAGVGIADQASAKFGDYTGFKRKGGYLLLDGELRWRNDNGYYGSASASNLGLDGRALSTQVGREGAYTLRLGTVESPHELTSGAMSPYLGIGGAVLTLPAGYPAATSGAMPLATTLQPVALGFTRKTTDLGATFDAGEAWSFKVSARHDERDGTQRGTGSFFSNTAQFALPVDQVTDQVDVAAAYAGRALQATLGYHASIFRNGADALTWSNPFTNGIVGNRSGQLALAPDNQFHQVQASLGYEILPRLRLSADVAVGRMTQNATYLAATLNPALSVPGLPAQSLDGRASTLNASLRLSASPTDRLRLAASWTRDRRDNDTSSLVYPSVSTDLFLGLPRSNPVYAFTHDRARLSADLRTPFGARLSFGGDYDTITRNLQEAGVTREGKLWGRVTAQPMKELSVALKAAHAERYASEYSAVATIDPAENPLLRKYNMADRKRDTAGLRMDLTVSETVQLGLSGDLAYDDYSNSTIGLLSGRSRNLGADVAVAVSDETQLQAFVQEERMRSQQAGSTLAARPDWWATSSDSFDVVGVGVKHLALKGKLELGAQLSFARSRSNVDVETGASTPALGARTSLDSLKLSASWQMSPAVTLIGNWWYERYDTRDWRYDGVLPATVPNLLALGEAVPRYHVNLLRVAVRYKF